MANIPKPITRTEMYYNYLATGTGTIPEPVTRQDQYLYYLCINGGIGGGGTTGTEAKVGTATVDTATVG